MTEVNLKLAQEICDLLNGLLEHDSPALGALISNKVPCSEHLANHPTIQASDQHGGYFVGLLGILNGLCGIHQSGNGPVVAKFERPDERNPNLYRDLIGFEVYSEGEDSPS